MWRRGGKRSTSFLQVEAVVIASLLGLDPSGCASADARKGSRNGGVNMALVRGASGGAIELSTIERGMRVSCKS